MALDVGTLVYNRYKIERILAQGGMGAIYRAVDESLGVVVAVKENLITSDESSRQFHREATILAGLRHPNLPRVTDHFVIAGQGQYLVMDFIEGEDLKERISRVSIMPEDEVILIGIAICDALDFLHSRKPPVVHRDIKPGNIKVTPTGQVFLVDFGLAKQASKGEHTTVGAQALTPGYAPPEQYGKGTDLRSDIYSLGATLYAALTGKTPEDGLARAMGSAVLIPMHQHNPQISQRVEAVISKALAVSPNSRFQTVDEFNQALANANTDAFRRSQEGTEIRIDAYQPTQSWTEPASMPGTGPVSITSQPSQSSISSQPASRFRIGYALAGALVLGIVVLGVGVVGVLYLLSGGMPSFTISQAPTPDKGVVTETSSTILPVTETNTPTETQMIVIEPSATPIPTDIPEPTATFTPAITPVGGGFGEIYFASERGGTPQIWGVNFDGSDLRQFTDMQDGACNPEWSPDGTRMVFVSPCKKRRDNYEGSGLFLINGDGSGLIPLATTPGGDFDPAWSPDGNRIAFTSLRDGLPHIYIFGLDDNTEVNLSSVSTQDRRPAWSPDGKYLAFETTRAGQPQIWYMPADGTDRPRELAVLAAGNSWRPDWSPDGGSVYYSQGDALPWLTSKDFINKSKPENQKIGGIRPIWEINASPDGYWLVFEYRDLTDPTNNMDIYRMMVNGSMLTRLTEDSAIDFHPVWRPTQ
jgi:eukaryotic-like serine/threonine-protein kinase